jgi:hypothetical protein
VYGIYDFTLYRTGKIGPVTVTVPTLAPSFDGVVVAAITSAAADSTPALIPRALDVDSIPLQLRVSTAPEDPRIRVPAAPVFAATFPRIRLVDAKPVAPIPLAEYPVEEKDDGGDGEVVLRAIIDVNGTAIVQTIEVQHATSPAFALSAARTLARYHFTPAHTNGCPVPQVVEIPFWFSLRP